jgi:hypothetical protein
VQGSGDQYWGNLSLAWDTSSVGAIHHGASTICLHLDRGVTRIQLAYRRDVEVAQVEHAVRRARAGLFSLLALMVLRMDALRAERPLTSHLDPRLSRYAVISSP